MSDTPKTDALQDDLLRSDTYTCWQQMAQLARELERENAALRQDKERLDWIASRKSTQLVYFTAAGWAIIKASGGDLLHECNIHDLRAAIDAARKEAKP